MKILYGIIKSLYSYSGTRKIASALINTLIVVSLSRKYFDRYIKKSII